MDNKGIDSNALDGIYTEAILFVAIFGVMSIISIIISKRNAKKYEIENPLEERKTAKREEKLKERPNDKATKILELSKMLKDGLIDKDEFQALKKEVFA